MSVTTAVAAAALFETNFIILPSYSLFHANKHQLYKHTTRNL